MQQRNKKTAYQLAYFGMLTAVAFLLGYVESLIPFSVGIYGVKLGLANLAVLIALYRLGAREAFTVSLLRVFLTGFTFGNLSMMLYSLAGGTLSCIVMIVARKYTRFSVTGVSILGGVFHNIGQLVVAVLVLQSVSLLFYGIVLLAAGTITGFVIGLVAGKVLQHLPDVSVQDQGREDE